MGDRIEVPLELADFEVVSTVLVDGWLQVEVDSTFPAACFHCGSVDVVGHGCHIRRIRDRGCGYPTVLVWRQRRFRCRDCGRTSRERHPALAGQKRISRRFIDQLGAASCNEPWIDVARRESVSWWRIAEAFTIKATGFDPYLGPAPKVLSIDEASFRRRFLFHTVLSAPEQRRVLELIPGRNQMSAFKALSSLPPAWKKEIETVVIDLYWPFRKAVDQVLPEARIVADKFHVIRVIDNAAQKVRIRHRRRVTVIGRDGGLSRQNNPRFQPEMWQSRWLFMGRRHALNPGQRADLENCSKPIPQSEWPGG